MIDTIPRPDASLPQFLAARARHASDGQLVLNASGGFIQALLALVWHGPGWQLLLSIAACICAFGLWGIFDRELGERNEIDSRAILRLLRVARAIVAAVGFAGAAAAMVIILGALLGRMIS